MNKTAVLLASLLIAACASASKQEPAPASQASDKATPTTVTTTAAVPDTGMESKKLAAEIQELQKQSVYFDFDKSKVKPQYQDVIAKEAQFIKEHDNDVVTVEGNADERGSNEYNLGLGSRRAESVEKSLEILGVQAKQIKIISYGEEKPRLTCHHEKCWKENRRADFVHSLG
jgi:peptidoglycan-associated lipoprotein